MLEITVTCDDGVYVVRVNLRTMVLSMHNKYTLDSININKSTSMDMAIPYQ